MTDTDTKPFWQSMTLWGSAATIVGVILPAVGIQVSPTAVHNFFNSVPQAIDTVLTFGGFVLTVWGRFRAVKPVVLTK